MDSSLLTLPPHLLERIAEILSADVDLPRGLRTQLERTTKNARASTLLEPAISSDGHDQAKSEPDEKDEATDRTKEVTPDSTPTIEIATVEKLARWSGTAEGQHRIRKAKLQPGDYALISLLAGTNVYVPPSRLALLESSTNPDRPNPFLPSHLSPRPPPLSGYRALNKQLTTTLNVLFSIAGSGAAVYVASVTGAGYTRETGVILGVLAAVVVGLAEVILLWIFVWRVHEGRKAEVEEWKGSRSLGVKDKQGDKEEVLRIEGDGVGQGGEKGEAEDGVMGEDGEAVAATTATKPEVRLRRRALRSEKADAES